MTPLEIKLKKCFNFIRRNFECQRCSRCCICIYEIDITEKEANKISKKTHVPLSNIVDKRIIKSEIYYFLKHEKYEPCKFLLDEKCIIYKLRPDSCKKYPQKLIRERSEIATKIEGELIIVIPPKCPAILKIIKQLENNFNAFIAPQEEEYECTEKLKQSSKL